MHLFFTFFVVVRYFAGALGNILVPKSVAAIAYRKLRSVSFDVPEKYRYAYKTLLSGMRQLLAFPIRKPAVVRVPVVIYDVAPDTFDMRREYLRFYGITEEMDFLPAQAMQHFVSRADRLAFMFLTIPMQLHVLIIGLFRQERSGLSSILRNCLLARNMLLSGKSIKHLYVFSIYDTNSAFLSSCAMRRGIFVSQITSEVPLYKWNRELVTNELILGIDYQRLEAERFRETMQYDRVVLFGPETYYQIAERYEHGPEKNKRIGFYSTGGWVRNRLGHLDQGTAMEDSESRLLADLNTILAGRSDIELVVYPHPRERAFCETESGLHQHYRNYLPDISFSIHQGTQPSNTLFDDVYLAVCYMTTLIFERAHAGRKSAIAYFRETDFPLARHFSHLEFTENREELRHLIERTY